KIQVPASLQGRVIDVSGYPEIQELYLASDLLVTDYSSVFFDFAALGRPMVFYAPDLLSYQNELRGFYLDYQRDLPGPVTTTQDELARELRARLFESPHDDVPTEFLDTYAPNDDGAAASRVVDAIFSHLPEAPSPPGPAQ
ncbi:MAG: CDP-glycerol glycerophosphotransferase family protein, partial [Angustibacter sp.]